SRACSALSLAHANVHAVSLTCSSGDPRDTLVCLSTTNNQHRRGPNATLVIQTNNMSASLGSSPNEKPFNLPRALWFLLPVGGIAGLAAGRRKPKQLRLKLVLAGACCYLFLFLG